MAAWMDGWMDGWTDGRMDGWKDGWMEARLERCRDGRREGRKDGWTTIVKYYSCLLLLSTTTSLLPIYYECLPSHPSYHIDHGPAWHVDSWLARYSNPDLFHASLVREYTAHTARLLVMIIVGDFSSLGWNVDHYYYLPLPLYYNLHQQQLRICFPQNMS